MMFQCICGFDIDRKVDFNHKLLFKLFFYWLVNCASLVYKLYIAFQIQERSFYWIVFSTGIFKKVNLFLLAY